MKIVLPRRVVLFGAAWLLTMSGLLAQSATISGTVRGTNGETLPGTNVVLQGQQKGTSTDGNGQYSIRSSAGATILGSFMVRGDTKGNTIMVGDHTQGLDFIHNVTIDQHVLRRNRQFDLIEVVKAHPELLGIGIDESTAILVKGNTFEVLGNSFVGIYDADQITGKATKFPTAQNSGSGPFYYLSRGQRFDLQARKLLTPPPSRPNEPAKKTLRP